MRNRCGNSHICCTDDITTLRTGHPHRGHWSTAGRLMLCEKAGCNLHQSSTFLTASCYRHKTRHTLTDFNGLEKQTLFFGAGITAETLQRKSKRAVKPAEGPDHPRSCSNKHESWGHIRPCFHWEAIRETDLKTFRSLPVSNLGCWSNPRRENRLWYLTQMQERCVIEWLACWVGSSAISSHSFTERSWLSHKWHLGSSIRNVPDWPRRRKLFDLEQEITLGSQIKWKNRDQAWTKHFCNLCDLQFFSLHKHHKER